MDFRRGVGLALDRQARSNTVEGWSLSDLLGRTLIKHVASLRQEALNNFKRHVPEAEACGDQTATGDVWAAPLAIQASEQIRGQIDLDPDHRYCSRGE